MDILSNLLDIKLNRTVLVGGALGLGALVLFIQGVVLTADQVRTEKLINRRLRFKDKVQTAGELIVELRRQRGLDEAGNLKLAIKWLNRLIVRSGLPFRPIQWTVLSALLACGVAAAIWWRFQQPVWGVSAGIVMFFASPVLVLKFLAGRRAKLMAKQLPDALQIVVRSLEAGHPVPGAIGLVAKEMPDPIGTEFGMATDEMAYGSSLTKAIERLGERAGDPDIDLFAATVRLQERTGGNLCDLLKTNADTVRDRQTLRLKVKAASAEGRASAMILTAAPFVVAAAVHFLRPEFFGLVAHEPLFKTCMIIFGVWMLIGNVIMNRMINFRF